MQIVEERAPDGFTNLDGIISREELEEISRVTNARRIRP